MGACVTWLTLAGCAPAPLGLEAEATPVGVRVRTTEPVDHVELLRADGVPVVRRDLTPTQHLTLPGSVAPGDYRLRARAGGRVAETSVRVEAAPPVTVEVQLAPGQPWRRPVGGALEVQAPRGGRVEVLVAVTAGPDHPTSVGFTTDVPRHEDGRGAQGASTAPAVQAAAPESDEPTHAPGTGESPLAAAGAVTLAAEGRREVRAVRVGDAPVHVRVGDVSFTLVPRPIDADTLRAALHLNDPVFPAGSDGVADLGRPTLRVALPSTSLERVLRSAGLGGRRRDPWAPWAFLGVPVRNTGDADLDVVVSVEILRDGAPDAAFRPRLRAADGDTGVTRSLLRVPPGTSATAALPVFVDVSDVSPGMVTAHLELRTIGGDAPIAARDVPIAVTQGDPAATTGFVVACVACVAGFALVAARLRAWIAASATLDLMTIALFGTAGFVAGAAADLLALSVGALLGPFSTLVTGLFTDVARVTLQATLLTLLPRPGILALSVLTAALLRAATLGAVAPADVLYVGVSVASAEGFAWIAGLTRDPSWRDASFGSRSRRLAVAFCGASACTTLAGIYLHVVLFRLFFADWYVALQVGVGAIVYTAVACRIAARVAPSLRAVSP